MSNSPLGFAVHERPRVSVVIPVHGKWHLTEQCLRSIAAGAEKTTFEVIVVDDRSRDETPGELRSIPGLRSVRTPSNVGFVGACNLGAEQAAGEILLFLNNDTLVHPNWLDALVQVLDADPTVGVVGSLLLGEDGLVQESGAIIWADGTGWNFGRGTAPDRGDNYSLRDVDYCSGASLAVRRQLFEQLGAFDQAFAPAYYEDVDLCFAARAAGYRVMVQPESVITHLEGASNGTAATGGLKRFEVVNRQVFLRKWRSVLRSHASYTGPGSLWTARNRRRGGMVLIVDPNVPMPDRDAGSRRMAGIIDQMLAMDLSVHFAPSELSLIQPYTRDLQRKGVTVLTTAADQTRFLAEAGDQLIAVMLCRPDVAWDYLQPVHHLAPDAVIIYDTVDLHSLRLHRQAEFEKDPGLSRVADLTWIKETSAMRAADVTLVVSEAEKVLLAELAPEIDVRVLSLIHEPHADTPVLAGRRDVVFVGGYQHLPNVDAAKWAVDEIMPLVRAAVPDATLQLIGSHMTPEVEALEGPGVVATGWVEDLEPVYERTRVVIAPLRYGAGVKGKVAEAIEFGVPLVGTSMALEGINLIDGTDVLIGDDAQTIASAIITLLTDDDVWTSMAGAGRARLGEQFSPAAARAVLEGILDTGRLQPRFQPLRHLIG